MIRLIITGGSGFIGTNLVDYYINTPKTEVLNIDINPPRNKKHINVWKQINILDYNSLESIILSFKPTHFIHLAARTDLDENKDISGYKANIEGVSNIISILRKCNNLERVIFTSSMLVCRVGYNPKSFLDYSPPNLYGESKVLTEKIIHDSDISEFQWCIIRPTSIWGPWFGKPYKDFFETVMRRRFFKILGKSSTKIFGFVGNSVYQIDKLLFIDETFINRKTFYIGDKPPININEWADELANLLGIKLIALPFFVFKIASILGDLLLFLGINFPITSFRLRNMTIDNKIDLIEETFKIIPENKFNRKQGSIITINWINESKKVIDFK